MSRFDTLLQDSAKRAAEALSDRDATTEELQAALCNALRLIARLEEQVKVLLSNTETF